MSFESTPTGRRRKKLGWALLGFAALAFLLVPFALWGDAIERNTARFADSAPAPAVAAVVFGALLALDPLLPVPSSFVSTGCGMLLGFVPGTLVSAAGMTAGALFGYGLGARAGRAGAWRLVGEAELAKVAPVVERWGSLGLAAMRPVPVLAEASVIFAGIIRFPIGRFSWVTMLANLGVSATYAAVGAWARESHAFLFAFAGAILLPGIVLLARKLALDESR